MHSAFGSQTLGSARDPAGVTVQCRTPECAALLFVRAALFCGAAMAVAGAAQALQVVGTTATPVGGLSGVPAATSTMASPVPAAQLSSSSLGSDSCASAPHIVGVGIFPFDTSFATTGSEGQTAGACALRSTTAINNDVWFEWTAPSSGTVILSTCGLTSIDTKIGIWDKQLIGGTCPTSQFGSIGCMDDVSPSIAQTKVVFAVVAGLDYIIQLGTYPGSAFSPAGVPGSGAFSIEYLPLPNPRACVADDGEADQALAVTTASNRGSCMIARYGIPGRSARVSAIDVVWGARVNAAGSLLVDGTPASVALWEDPNDDGDPSDAVLLEVAPTTIQNHDTDMFNQVQLATTHTLSGYFFVGAIFRNSATPGPNLRPFQLDWDSDEVLPYDPFGPFVLPYQARTFVGNASGAFDPASLAPSSLNQSVVAFLGGVFMPGYVSSAYNSIPLIRPTCYPEAGAPFCSNDTLGTDHMTPCPCSNSGSIGNGCSNSFNADGARLTAYGNVADDDILGPGPQPMVLSASGMPATSFTMFIQHDAPGDTRFHDGVLCASGGLVRLRGRNAGTAQFMAAGTAVFPNSNFANDSTLTLSSRGGVVVGSGATRYYAAWYRNASTTFCPPATANVTNGWRVTW